MDEWRDEGFQLIYAVTQDYSGGEVSQEEAMNWAERWGFVDIPVLIVPPDLWDELTDLYYLYETDGYIPTITHIGPDGEMRSADENLHSPRRWLSR